MAGWGTTPPSSDERDILDSMTKWAASIVPRQAPEHEPNTPPPLEEGAAHHHRGGDVLEEAPNALVPRAAPWATKLSKPRREAARLADGFYQSEGVYADRFTDTSGIAELKVETGTHAAAADRDVLGAIAYEAEPWDKRAPESMAAHAL